MNDDGIFLSLSEFLFEKIAGKIMDGSFKIGQKLVENDIQTEFKVSKSPVREAFQMLISVGLVEREARRGCFVKRITPEAVVDNYIVRAGLERIAAKIAYSKATAESATELRNYFERMADAVARNDMREYLKYHDRFQAFFSEKSSNETLIDICKKIRMQNMWYRTQYMKVDLASDLHTHDGLLEHFEKRDISDEEFGRLMEAHVQVGLTNFMKFYSVPEAGMKNG